MLEFEQIQDLIKQIDNSTIDEFELTHGSMTIKLSKKVTEVIPLKKVDTLAPVTPVTNVSPVITEEFSNKQEAENDTPKIPVVEGKFIEITSPMVGTFYSSPSPDKDVFVKEGSVVHKGDIVCIVEAMKLFNEIEAEIDGTIEKVLAKNGQLVEYGQPLFLVRPNKGV